MYEIYKVPKWYILLTYHIWATSIRQKLAWSQGVQINASNQRKNVVRFTTAVNSLKNATQKQI